MTPASLSRLLRVARARYLADASLTPRTALLAAWDQESARLGIGMSSYYRACRLLEEAAGTTSLWSLSREDAARAFDVAIDSLGAQKGAAA